MPPNQTKAEGNDDQSFWAFTALEAAELNFPPPQQGYPSWIAQGQAVFNKQAERWDDATCGGGLRWQIFTFNNGYNYKNIAANGAFFQIASRLARYTGNGTYVDWAEKSWDWFTNSVLWDNATSTIFDGTTVTNNCSDADHTQWTYNYGFWIAGLAYIYNHTEDTKWLTPLEGIVDQALKTFAPQNDVFVEITCEPTKQCDTDNYSFKAYTLRWLAVTTQLVPTLASKIMPYIIASGKGAAGQCDGGTDGITCGFAWTTSTWDGSYGVGQQMSALSAIQANMLGVANLAPPFTAENGGTSVGDPSAGTGSNDADTGKSAVYTNVITTADRAGAGILTALALILTLGGTAWLLVG
nr:mannan endo-1,6-alpha-mannosidase dcw1 [Quercus suber]